MNAEGRAHLLREGAPQFLYLSFRWENEVNAEEITVLAKKAPVVVNLFPEIGHSSRNSVRSHNGFPKVFFFSLSWSEVCLGKSFLSHSLETVEDSSCC